MEEYEVIEHIKKDVGPANNTFSVVAISYIVPTYVKFESETDFKAGEKVGIDKNEVFYKGSKIGEVKTFKSAENVKVNTDYDIKYTGGYSTDGKKVYLDRNFPKLMDVDGKKVDTVESIAKHHEITEKWLIDDAYEYAYAHEIATKIEREYVESLGVNWDAYCKEVDKNLHAVYNTKADNTPSDLDLSPYFYSKDEKALKEIRETKG